MECMRRNALSSFVSGWSGDNQSEDSKLTKRTCIYARNSRTARSLAYTSGLQMVVMAFMVALLSPHITLSADRREMSERSVVKKEKRFGQIFTPPYLVEDILDFAEYVSDPSILRKHVIDNSCGDGAFLVEIVRRYCTAYIQVNGKGNRNRLSGELGEFIHGIEIDSQSYRECLQRLDQFVKDEFNLSKVKWDIHNADTMSVTEYDKKMDFVVGNPPYVRVHNLDDDFARVKKFSFCSGGMTDLYLVFYEIGLKMLAPHGRLCYIAPSSWINSIAGKCMREYLQRNKCLRGIVDLCHYQPFAATTYTAICLLENSYATNKFSYCVYESPNNIRLVDILDYNVAFFDDALYLGDSKTLQAFKKIKTAVVPSVVEVKNGFATLSDSVFISDEFPFDKFLIPVVKASTGRWRKAFFPYDKHGKPLPEALIFGDERTASYLVYNENKLCKGRKKTNCPNWYLYGRTQALKDVWKPKYAINTVIRDTSSIKFTLVPAGAGVYSGLYILSDIPESKLREAIFCDSFLNYISVLKKYKSGGYYTFSSRDLEQYLNFKLQKESLQKKRKIQQTLNFNNMEGEE